MANPGPAISQTAMNLQAVAAGAGRTVIPCYISLALVVDATDYLTAFPLTFKGRLLAVDFVTHAKVTTASKAATLTPKIKKGTTTTAVTGGVVALTSALATPEGALIPGSAVTALNSFNSGDSLTLSWTGVTAFSEGTGHILLTVVNDDTMDAIARGGFLFNP
jgi:hypothetical protein